MARKKTRFLTVGLATYAYPMLGSIGDINKSAPVSVYMFSSSPVTLSDSYTIISSEEEFLAFAGDADGWDKNYVLACDIDLAGRTDFTPIGARNNMFTGMFSGGGHTINDLTIDLPDGSNVGLFGSSRGVIADLAVTGNITGNISVGGICGYSDNLIYGCSFEGTVTGGNGNTGGICGSNHAKVGNRALLP